MGEKKLTEVPLSANERSMVKLIADRDGITEDEAASNLAKAWLERKAKKKGSKGGRVMPLRRKK